MSPAEVRVTGTDDPVEVAAVLALLAARGGSAPVASGYDRWREQRVRALGRSGITSRRQASRVR